MRRSWLILLGLLLLTALAGVSQTITMADTTNVGCTISATNPCPRAGLNLGQPNGTYPQFKNYLQFANPGFEPQQVQQIFQFAVNPCTFCSATTFQWNVSNTNFTNYDANQWVGANFTVIAGCYSTMTGCTGGSNSDPAFGCTGTIASNTVATGGFGSQFTINNATNQGGSGCAGPLGIPGQVIVIGTNSSMTNVGPPSTVGFPQASISTSGTATVTAENTDLCAGCGTQSVDFNSGSGTISMTLSNTAYQTGSALKTIDFNGNYTVKFWAKSVSGSTTALTFQAIARNGNCANPSPCNYNPTLTTSWAQYTHTFALNESAATLNAFNFGMIISVATGAEVRFDNIEFDDASTNPTAYSDTYVNALKAYCQTAQNTTGPGCSLRYGPSPDSETMANWTKSVFLAQPSTEAANSNNIKFTQNTFYATQKPRIYDFLQLCAYLGATPVLIWPVTFTTTDVQSLVDYLEDNSGITTYGAIRQSQGQSTAWVGQAGSPFGVIYLEYGNENWNGLFLGHALFSHSNNPNNYYDYAARMGVLLAAARSRQNAQGYSTSVTKWSANGQTGSTTDFQYLTAYVCGQLGYSGGTITCTQGGEDVIEIQQYYGVNIGGVSNANCTTGGSSNATCGLYGPTLTETWSDIHDASSTSGSAQSFNKIPTITACGPSHNAACQAATYERAIYPTGTGTFTQSVSDTFTQTGWHGVADAISYADSDSAGLAYIDEYASQAYFLGSGGVNVHIYGAMIDAGGDCSTTNSVSVCPRPQMGAAEVVNWCKIGQEVQTTGSSIPTYNLAANSNGVHAINSVPNLTFHEYKIGNTRCLLINNNDIFSSYTVTLAGTNVPTTVTQFQQAPSSPTATNEATALNATNTTVLGVVPVLTNSVNVSGGFTAPPTSTTALLFTTGGTSVTVDFGSRSGGTTIPANLIGTNLSAITGSVPYNGTAGSYLTPLPRAGFHRYRLPVDVNQNCPAGSCGSWGVPDAQLAAILSADPSAKILAYFYNTPSNLGATPQTPPSNSTTWESYVAAGLTHFASSHPGTIEAVEIWNEPDGGGTWTGTLGQYTTLFQTAGPLLHSSFPSILIAGPALASPGPHTASWLGSGGIFTGGYFPDVVSYHLYLNGSYASWANVLSDMQSPSGGIGHYFDLVQTTLAGVGFSGQIWVSEYNDSYLFPPAVDCCRFDATFSPVWNGLNVIDYLNVVNTYTATSLPNRIDYFTNESGGGFCLTGNPGALNCGNAPTPLDLYPPYYAYLLMNNLALNSGGHVAASISPASTTAGVSCSAFYTATGDAVMCANPTAVDATSTPFTFNNAGILNAQAVSYLLNASNPTITASAVSLSTIAGGYTATATIPANSVFAINLTPQAETTVGPGRTVKANVTIH